MIHMLQKKLDAVIAVKKYSITAVAKKYVTYSRICTNCMDKVSKV